jgi:hypothetical protein
MLKRMILLAIAVGALIAFAVPAAASAAVLTDGGLKIKPGTELTLSGGIKVGGEMGTLNCYNDAKLSWKIAEDTETKAAGSAAGTFGHCESNDTTIRWEFKEAALSNLTLNNNGTGTVGHLSFNLTAPGIGIVEKCPFFISNAPIGYTHKTSEILLPVTYLEHTTCSGLNIIWLAARLQLTDSSGKPVIIS